ncbi:MAG: 2-oxoacid:acceptor oxidoreductase subunit alpha, partial [Holophagales bacterium]|nr:2-oxoacid:acceptor oxidoreductase subunit alpha [Holophagales bacterium]
MTSPASVRDEAAATEKAGAMPEQLTDVVIRFAGDSGDGMQLTGSQFTNTSAIVGNDLSTLPDFPAEIRAPVGTLPGVSAFQVRIADYDIHTPGDRPDVLVAMNPAALKTNLADLAPNGILILNENEFKKINFKKAKYETDPREDGSLDGYRVFQVELTRLTREALADFDLDNKSRDRCKNMFALGMVYWLFSRPLETTLEWLEKKFAKKPEVARANARALRAGWNYCDITGAFQVRYEVAPAQLQPGLYRNVNGNSALAMGLVAASRCSGLTLFLGSYPITPASTILHELARYKHFGVATFQAEDEIAAVCAAIGAAFGGSLGVTTTSGPGLALKSEGMNLAVMTELPLVVIDVQRAGPSTGMPTKTEQSDLLQVMFGRNGESPLPVIAPSSPADCFDAAIEACRMAIRHMTPVALITNGYLANGSEPWRLPRVEDLPDLQVDFASAKGDDDRFLPYRREEATLARPWAIPGTPGFEHRIGGLEKAELTGNVSYDPDNHERMTHLRAAKVERIADSLSPIEIDGPPDGGLLVLGWGSTLGAITGAVNEARRAGIEVSRAHLRHLNPLPHDLGDVLARFEKVLLPELNTGQLAMILRARYLKDIVSFSKIQGKPFMRHEILA